MDQDEHERVEVEVVEVVDRLRVDIVQMLLEEWREDANDAVAG